MIKMFSPTRDIKTNRNSYQINIDAVLDHGQFINGPEIKTLEDRLAYYVDVKHAVGVSSGTDALLIALMAIGIEEGDEVITTPFTWISTVEVIKLLGARVVFCDIDKRTFNIDMTEIKNKITERTRVIIPVSLFGHIYDNEELDKVINQFEYVHGNKIYVVEDGAQSFGSINGDNKKSCGVSTIGCTSFFPSKPLGCFGDGGMCFTNNNRLAKRMKAIRNHGSLKRYEYKYLGINGRLDTLQASILLAKFDNFEESLKKRIAIADKYNAVFFRMFMVIRPPHVSSTCFRHVYAQYTILLENEKTRDLLKDFLKENDIESSIFYPKPLHLVKTITEEYREGSMPITEDFSRRVLSLPVYPELKPEEQTKIIETVKRFFNV